MTGSRVARCFGLQVAKKIVKHLKKLPNTKICWFSFIFWSDDLFLCSSPLTIGKNGYFLVFCDENYQKMTKKMTKKGIFVANFSKSSQINVPKIAKRKFWYFGPSKIADLAVKRQIWSHWLAPYMGFLRYSSS